VPPARTSLTERLFYPPRAESLARQLLLSPLDLASACFAGGIWTRERLLRRGWIATERVEGLRVVSVGNINVGGSGKTPAVIWLAERLSAAGRRVAVLSRGHGRATREPLLFGHQLPEPASRDSGDEPLLISRRCPAAFVLVGPDRLLLAQRSREELGVDVALLDDGFQHRRLQRDVDIVVVDEAVGLGNGRLLPRGPLREPARALERASLVWLKTASGAPAKLPRWSCPTVRARHVPLGWRAPDGAMLPLHAMAGQHVLALAGLARPSGFLSSLEQVGAEVADTALFADHHAFSEGELSEVAARAKRGGWRIVTTEKDAVRLPPAFPVWTLRLGVEILEGERELQAALGLG